MINPLDQVLLDWGSGDQWTVRDACAGTLIFGDTGSGKTTGSGRSIALAMLRAGFGGLVLTVKSSETDRWREYMWSCGREDDLIVFSPESGHAFNFLHYEHSRASRGGGQTENLVELLVQAMNAAAGSGAAVSSDPFWDKALRQILRNAIEALVMGGEDVTLSSLHRFVCSVPTDAHQLQDKQWQASSYAMQVMQKADLAVGEDVVAQQTLETTYRYWFGEFACVMDPRTRGNIISTLTTTCDGFLRGELFRMFSTETTVAPDETLRGKVIVLDMPKKQFHQLGVVGQLVWKLSWQRCVEEAKRAPGDCPVFLWVDEAHHFVTKVDQEFVTTAREQLACCVYLTQSKSNYLNAFGPSNQAAAESFLGVPKTKIFHCNGDSVTNQWASATISDDWQLRVQHSRSKGEARNAADQSSTSTSMNREPLVPPSDFGMLRCGGPPDFAAEAIVYQSGRQFRETRRNYMKVQFDQQIQGGQRERGSIWARIIRGKGD